MTCPKCQAPMERIDYKGVELDRCTNCRGLWFDLLEQEDLKKLAGSGSVDSGSRRVGRKLDRFRDYDCPKCEAPMIPMADAEVPNLRFESCSHCYGVFFDAGEFAKYTADSFFDRLQLLLSRPRR